MREKPDFQLEFSVDNGKNFDFSNSKFEIFEMRLSQFRRFRIKFAEFHMPFIKQHSIASPKFQTFKTMLIILFYSFSFITVPKYSENLQIRWIKKESRKSKINQINADAERCPTLHISINKWNIFHSKKGREETKH